MKLQGLAVAAGVGLSITLPVQADAGPVIKTQSGPVEGLEQGAVVSFKGLPYAAPPIGDLRWRPPATAPAWSTPLQANQFGPACPQPPPPNRKAGGERLSPGRQSEDCLTLNVWTPAAMRKLQPVMVWIHGGGFRIGASSLPRFDGGSFARRGVVVVTLNYRLGALGVFDHPLLRSEGQGADFGLMDQIAALRWVRANIRAFGGDPDNVTLVGESAGGASVLFLMQAPAARGLFQKAIVQSAAGFTPTSREAQAASDAALILSSVGHQPTSTAELRALPVEALVSSAIGRSAPVQDNVVITEPPCEAIRAGRAARVPLLIGSNGDEATPLMLTQGLTPDGVFQTLGDDARSLYGAGAITTEAAAHAAFTDARFAAPARRLARYQSTWARSYLYHFDYVLEHLRAEALGPGHSDEIPFVFDSWSAIATTPTTANDRAVSRRMNRCWQAFMQDGRPSGCGAKWPAYDVKSDVLLHVATSVTARPAFRAPQMVWQDARASC